MSKGSYSSGESIFEALQWYELCCSETGRSLLAVDTNVLMERAGRAALTAWLAHTDGAAALLIPHVRALYRADHSVDDTHGTVLLALHSCLPYVINASGTQQC